MSELLDLTWLDSTRIQSAAKVMSGQKISVIKLQLNIGIAVYATRYVLFERYWKNEAEWAPKLEIRTAEFLAVGEICVDIFWPIQGFKNRTQSKISDLRREDLDLCVRCIQMRRYIYKYGLVIYSDLEEDLYWNESFCYLIIIYPLTTRVVRAPQILSQPVFSIFPCSPLSSGICRTPGLSIPWCCLPISSSVCLTLRYLSSILFNLHAWTQRMHEYEALIKNNISRRMLEQSTLLLFTHPARSEGHGPLVHRPTHSRWNSNSGPHWLSCKNLR